jgi:hypothetical protein
MPIRFTCPHCGAQSNVGDQYAGQTGPCAQCGKPIRVPAFSEALDRMPERTRSPMTTLVIVLVASLGVLVVCGGFLAALLLPAVQAAREAARTAQCTNHVRQLMLALHTYHDLHRKFPPAYTTDADGKPLHSWRVLLLPYLEEKALYDQFRLDEPWDSPHNRALAARMPAVYRCPSDRNPNLQQTTYVLVTGKRTAFAGSSAAKLDDMTDRGATFVLIVAESADSGILWTEPRDVDVSALNQGLNAPAGQGLRSAHPGVVIVGYADGRVERLEKGMDPRLLVEQARISQQDPPAPDLPAEQP